MDKQEQYMDKYMTSVQGFNKTVRDIPHTAVLKETVGNRPYSTFVVIASFLFFFGFIMPKIRIPMFIAAAVVFVAMYLFHNKPILKIYEGFIVLYNYMDGKDNPRVAIIADEDLISWDSKSTIGYNTSFKYRDGEETKLIGLNSMNFQGCSSAMNKHYHDKLETLVKLNEYKKEMSKSKVSFGSAVKNMIKLNEKSKQAEQERNNSDKQ
ncbi:MAG: hypothetical protein IJL94_00460 [Erysipelotrichaceae bacterium]|nr:hypothetical protein [Erysipelotrichaceae bacterium]